MRKHKLSHFWSTPLDCRKTGQYIKAYVFFISACVLKFFTFISHFSITNDIQIQVSSAFINKFQLTENDLVALHGSKNNKDITITNEIFSALDKVQKIHNDCKILMQSGHQTLALDVMEEMTLHQVR